MPWHGFHAEKLTSLVFSRGSDEVCGTQFVLDVIAKIAANLKPLQRETLQNYQGATTTPCILLERREEPEALLRRQSSLGPGIPHPMRSPTELNWVSLYK